MEIKDEDARKKENPLLAADSQDFLDVCERVRRRLDYQASNLVDEFGVFDQDGSKSVKLATLIEGIGIIAQCPIAPHIEKTFTKKLRCLKHRKVNYMRVVSLVFYGHTNTQLQVLSNSSATETQFLEQIRTEMKTANLSSMDMFELFDANGDGYISQEEFSEALDRRMIMFSDSEARDLYSTIKEKCPNGYVNLKSFRTIVFGYLGRDARPLLQKVKNLL